MFFNNFYENNITDKSKENVSNHKLDDNDYANKLFPDIKLHHIEIRGGDSWFGVDSFFLGKGQKSVDSREPGIIPNVWIQQLRNQAKSAENVFNVEMIERTCGYEIPDFEVNFSRNYKIFIQILQWLGYPCLPDRIFKPTAHVKPRKCCKR